MSVKTFCTITAVIFAVIALLHLARVVLGWPAMIAGWSVPMWVSWLGLVVAAVLSYFGWRAAARA
jgi:hypothetical protein